MEQKGRFKYKYLSIYNDDIDTAGKLYYLVQLSHFSELRWVPEATSLPELVERYKHEKAVESIEVIEAEVIEARTEPAMVHDSEIDTDMDE